jgi:glycosyltransferase involved in cell wall biosynthesis
MFIHNPDIPPLNLVYNGVIFLKNGFGEASRNTIWSLDNTGRCKVKVVPYLNWDCPSVDYFNQPSIRRLSELKKTRHDESAFKMWITMMDPLSIKARPGYYNIAYAMFETEVFPKDFVNVLNKVNEVWTPSQFCKDSMEASGLQNVRVMPLGVDVERFNPNTVTPLGRPSGWEDKFVFLCIGIWCERKGHLLLAEAFAEEFDGCDDVALYYKSNYYSTIAAQKEVDTVTKHVRKRPQIKIDFNQYSDTDIPRLYKMSDCFVMPTRGEGWGLEFSEAMSMGLPTVATNWGGQLQFMNKENSYLIQNNGTARCKETERIYPYYVNAKFGNPDKYDLRRILRRIYENQDEAKAKGKAARQHMISNFTWDIAGAKHYERLREIESMPRAITKPQEPVKPQELVVKKTWWGKK